MPTLIKHALDVNITKRHIRDAEAKNARKCAIAQAIVESDPDIVYANVTTTFVKFARESNERVACYRTPKAARDFIIAFDTGRSPRPFRLTLTEEEFTSERPRQMRQAATEARRSQQREVAKAAGKPTRSIRRDELPPRETFDGEGFAKTPKEKPVRKSRTATTSRRTYGYRPTAAEVFAA